MAQIRFESGSAGRILERIFQRLISMQVWLRTTWQALKAIRLTSILAEPNLQMDFQNLGMEQVDPGIMLTFERMRNI